MYRKGARWSTVNFSAGRFFRKKGLPKQSLLRALFTCGDGAEKGVGLELIHPARDKADDKPHQARPQAVAQGSAKDGAEARCGEEVAEVVDGNGVLIFVTG